MVDQFSCLLKLIDLQMDEVSQKLVMSEFTVCIGLHLHWWFCWLKLCFYWNCLNENSKKPRLSVLQSEWFWQQKQNQSTNESGFDSWEHLKLPFSVASVSQESGFEVEAKT